MCWHSRRVFFAVSQFLLIHTWGPSHGTYLLWLIYSQLNTFNSQQYERSVVCVAGTQFVEQDLRFLEHLASITREDIGIYLRQTRRVVAKPIMHTLRFGCTRCHCTHDCSAEKKKKAYRKLTWKRLFYMGPGRFPDGFRKTVRKQNEHLIFQVSQCK